MSGTSLSDDAHVSRYCRPSAVGQDGLPLPAAFQLKAGEDHLSVNWLEYFGTFDLDTAVAHVRTAFRAKGYSIRPNGRFSVLRVGSAKEAVSAASGHPSRIEHLPLDNDASHSGIFGYRPNDLAVAAELKILVGHADVHPGT